MKEIKASFANGYIVETLSGRKLTIVSSDMVYDKKDKNIIVNDELVKLLDKITKK